MSYKPILIAAISLGALTTLAGANAQPLSESAFAPATKANVVQVQYREGYGRSDRGRDDDDSIFDLPGEAVSGATGLVGGVLGDNEDGGGQGVAACARRFRSFDPSTGTYVTYSGERVMCPYLRG